jgi:membrane-bound metal-dependent hydrolase YbcI (DUF457 family)
MDSVTQIVLGIAVAEVTAGKTLKNRGFLYGAILGTIPDLDVVVGQFLNPIDGILIHRGMSHSVLFALLFSLLLGWCITKIEKQRISFKTSYWMSFWCLFTHALLDMCTTWGTQIFWPLPYRFSANTIFVIDPLYTIPFMIFLIMVWRTKDIVLRRKYVMRGLYISCGYLALACCIKLYADNQFTKALAKQNISYDKLMTKPTPFNLILWNANVATKDAYLLGDYSLFDTQPITFTVYPKHPEIEARLGNSVTFEKLKHISEGWYIVNQVGPRLYFNDLRFGLLDDNPKAPQFVFSYEIIPSSPDYIAIEVPKNKGDGKALLKKLFTRLKGN